MLIKVLKYSQVSSCNCSATRTVRICVSVQKNLHAIGSHTGTSTAHEGYIQCSNGINMCFFIKTSVNQGIFDLGVLIHLPFPPIFSAYANLTACLCMPFLTIINTQEWHLSFHVSHGVLANRDTRTPSIVKRMCDLFSIKDSWQYNCQNRRREDNKKPANRHIFLINWQALYVTRVLLLKMKKKTNKGHFLFQQDLWIPQYSSPSLQPFLLRPIVSLVLLKNM